MSNHCNSTTLSTIKFDPSLSCLNSCNKTKLKDDLKSVLKMASSDTQTPQLVSTIHQNILHNVDLNSNALKTAGIRSSLIVEKVKTGNL